MRVESSREFEREELSLVGCLFRVYGPVAEEVLPGKCGLDINIYQDRLTLSCWVSLYCRVYGPVAEEVLPGKCGLDRLKK